MKSADVDLVMNTGSKKDSGMADNVPFHSMGNVDLGKEGTSDLHCQVVAGFEKVKDLMELNQVCITYHWWFSLAAVHFWNAYGLWVYFLDSSEPQKNEKASTNSSDHSLS